MLLKGFGFSGYRSFGDDLTKVAPLRKVNLIIGKNNVGKSNIINFLKEQYPYFVSKAKSKSQVGRNNGVPFQELDRHISKARADHRISFPVFKNEVDEYIESKLPDESRNRSNRRFAKRLLLSEQLIDSNGDIWFTYTNEEQSSRTLK